MLGLFCSSSVGHWCNYIALIGNIWLSLQQSIMNLVFKLRQHAKTSFRHAKAVFESKHIKQECMLCLLSLNTVVYYRRYFTASFKHISILGFQALLCNKQLKLKYMCCGKLHLLKLDTLLEKCVQLLYSTFFTWTTDFPKIACVQSCRIHVD